MNENIIRRGVALATSAALAASLVAAAAGPVTAANGPKKDFVAGGGVHVGVGVFNVSAHNDGPLPGDAKGSLTLKTKGTKRMMKADVTCLWVRGNDAYVTATMTRSSAEYQNGETVVLHVQDNGNGADRARFSWDGAIYPAEGYGGPVGCYWPYLAPVPVEKGNVNVNDAS